jgi:hypothetical protein
MSSVQRPRVGALRQLPHETPASRDGSNEHSAAHCAGRLRAGTIFGRPKGWDGCHESSALAKVTATKASVTGSLGVVAPNLSATPIPIGIGKSSRLSRTMICEPDAQAPLGSTHLRIRPFSTIAGLDNGFAARDRGRIVHNRSQNAKRVTVSCCFGAPSTTRTCDLLVRSGKKGVNRGQRDTCPNVFGPSRSPEITREHLEPRRIVCRLSVAFVAATPTCDANGVASPATTCGGRDGSRRRYT